MNRGQSRLEWVQRNRARHFFDRARPASTLVLELARALGEQQGAVCGEVGERLSRVVDDEFRRHCRLQVRTAGVLEVMVAEPNMLAMLKRKWRDRILRALSSHKGVTRLVFTLGDSGMTVPFPSSA